MNVTVLQVQIVIFACPCAKACRVQTPLDDLADCLRREMQHGRESHVPTIDPTPTMLKNMARFHEFQHN